MFENNSASLEALLCRNHESVHLVENMYFSNKNSFKTKLFYVSPSLSCHWYTENGHVSYCCLCLIDALFVFLFNSFQGLLDNKGIPQGFAGLATHLHYHEPANLFFIHLLKNKVLHQICQKEGK